MEFDMTDLPDSWQKRRIRDVGAVVTGRTPSTKHEDFYGGDYNLISPADLDNGKYVITAHKRLTNTGFMQCRALPKDTVLVGCIGNVGKLGMVADKQSATNQQINAVICNQENNPHFIYYSFHSNRSRLEQAADKTTLPILNKTNFENFEIAVPPLAEQHKIASVLGLVQRAIEQQERLIALTTELKKALLHQLFTEGLRGEPQKQTDIGPVPESWEVVRLGEFCALGTGTTPSTARPDYYNGDVPFVKTTHIVNNRIKKSETHVSKQAVNDCGLKLYSPGTVLMAMYGQGKTRCQVALLDISAATSQNAAAIQPSEDINSEFLWQYLMSRYQVLRNSGALGHISHLNLGYVRDFQIPKPPVVVQCAIAEILGTIDRRLMLIESKRHLFHDLFRTLLHQLMTAEIRVHNLDLSELYQEGKAEMPCGST